MHVQALQIGVPDKPTLIATMYMNLSTYIFIYPRCLWLFHLVFTRMPDHRDRAGIMGRESAVDEKNFPMEFSLAPSRRDCRRSCHNDGVRSVRSSTDQARENDLQQRLLTPDPS